MPDRWFITAYQETARFEAYHIVLTTDAPCHLWLRWSKNKPQRHPISRVLRGLAVMGDVYYCFTAFTDIEQDEAGDTLEHTFTMSPWPLSIKVLPAKHLPDLSGPPYWEPWGDTLTENHPWYQRIADRPVQYELKDPGIYLYDPAGPGAGINTLVSSNSFPLRSPSNAPLHFKSRCPFTYTVFTDDWISYQIYTYNGSEVQLLELVIDRGGFWGPWGSLKSAWNGKAAIDYGKWGEQFDLLGFWKWARQHLGKSTDPAGWYVSTVHIQFEWTQEPTQLQLTSDYLNFYYPPSATVANYTDPRWFYFHGEVLGMPSPSTSPIFGRALFYDTREFNRPITATEDEARVTSPTLARAPVNPPPTLHVGRWNAPSVQLGNGLRWPNFNVPIHAVILDAYLYLVCHTTRVSHSVNTRISALQVDNAASFYGISYADFMNRWAQRGVSANWDNIPVWTAEETYQSINFKAVIQEFIERPTWSSGNALILFWEDFAQRSTWIGFNYRRAYPWNNTPSKAPRLFIRYDYWQIEEVT